MIPLNNSREQVLYPRIYQHSSRGTGSPARILSLFQNPESCDVVPRWFPVVLYA
jgi:hypothetical protein